MCYDVFKTLKTTLHTIIQDTDDCLRVNEIVLKLHHLRCHMLQLTKLYILHLYKNKFELPKLDRGFFQCVIRTLSFSPNKRRDFKTNKELADSLSDFYFSHYQQLRVEGDTIDITGLRSIVNYMITDVITDIVCSE